ncbi:TRAP transporter substrate-binding protein [Treponema parvum]|uniref:TRAP transporter substrate-binding protein n=1 Tax=Treponema parvum TaxID=138851 RepID=UPI001AEBE9EE|nr:TRAP transporter substrate-binding protein [Treponema parvum]QTQ17182.1 TRAP transporter substrate-binding protein [Treponema parvum]
MKKGFVKSVLPFMCVLALLGCAKEKKTGADTAGKAAKKYTWTAALNVAETTINYKIVAKFKENIERESNGAVVVNIYPNGQLGGDREMLEGLVNGSINFSSTMTSGMVGFVPQYAIFDMPSVFSDITNMRKVLSDKEFIDKMNSYSKANGIYVLGYSDAGFRQMTSNKLAESVAGMKGIKIRVIQNPYHIEYWKLLGANPLPMDFSEVYIGLQQGEIDAQENPYMNIVGNKFYEAQKYAIETNHLGHTITFLMNNALYEGLSEDMKRLVDKCAADANNYGNGIADDSIIADKKVCTDAGMKIIELSAAEHEKMKAMSQPVYNMVTEKVGSELVSFFLKKIEDNK